MKYNYNPPKNIIIRMPNWLGDIVMATPLLEDLRRAFPTAMITAMCQEPLCTVLDNNPFIDTVFSYRRPTCRKMRRDLIERLRKGAYDMGILTTNSLSSAWWFWCGKVKNRIGFAANGRNILLSKAVSFPLEREKQHLVLTYKDLLVSCGMPVSDSVPFLSLSDEELACAAETLFSRGIPARALIIGINATAAYGRAKCWPPDRFVALTKRLLDDANVHVIYFGDNAGKPDIDMICSEFSSRVHNLAGATTLREFMALIDRCTVFVTNDSGPMHVAAAIRTPLVAIFGSTNDRTTGPYKWGCVVNNHVSCSPCYRRECPTDFRCMKSIAVNDIYTAVQGVIRGTE